MDKRWRNVSLPLLFAVGLLATASVPAFAPSVLTPQVAIACSPARPMDQSQPPPEAPNQLRCDADCTCR